MSSIIYLLALSTIWGLLVAALTNVMYKGKHKHLVIITLAAVGGAIIGCLV